MSKKKIWILISIILLSAVAIVALVIEGIVNRTDPQGTPVTNTGDSGQCETPPGPGEYREVTKNQVEGVIEGDVFKRSTNYFWYLSSSSGDWDDTGKPTNRLFLSAYLIGNDPKSKPFELIIAPEAGTDFRTYRGIEEKMYLSADSKTVTIFSSYCYESYDFNLFPFTAIISIDVSKPTPKEVSRRYVSGGFVSSRLADGKFLLITQCPSSSLEEYLELSGTLEPVQSLPLDGVPSEHVANRNYTVIYSFDEKSPESIDSVGFFSDADAIYISQEHIYIAHSYNERNDTNTVEMSEITCISYRNGLNPEGSFSVEGTALNQYSFDEKDGVLRLFTVGSRDENYNSSCVDYDPAPPPVLSGNLFCIKLGLGGFQTLSIVRDFASGYEQTFSVHFDGDKVYVYVGKHDGSLLYEFDFSDDSNVTWKETSAPSDYYFKSLAKFFDNTLVVISNNQWRDGVKIELFNTDGDDIECIATYKLENVNVFSDISEYFIDAEHGIIGFSFYQYDDSTNYSHSAFIVLRFDGEKLTELFSTSDYFYGTRACIIDGYIYILDDYKLTVEPLYFLN